MSYKYDKDEIDELCSKVDLLDYASKTFDFERHGKDYYTHCPLHIDKTPSLSITPSENLWYCHSCHKGGNIIKWLMVYENLRFDEAISKIEEITGYEIQKRIKPSSVTFFKQIKNIYAKPQKEFLHREILDSSYMDQFKVIDGEPHEWIEEGISESIMHKYGVRIDTKGNRIVYPVYDNDGNLIGAKGRTRYDNFKILGISKYMNYTKVGTTDYFQGMKENRQNIIVADEAIVVEGLKSVMKIDGFGQGNVIASETSVLNDMQARILIQLGIKNVVFGFDSDVTYAKIIESANKVKRFMNTFIIYDDNHLLGEKMSPCDMGKEIWDKLYESRRRIV